MSITHGCLKQPNLISVPLQTCCTDEIITPSLQIIFNGGCRTIHRSQAVNDNAGLIACTRCCNSTGNSSYYMECNSNMCGLKSRNRFSQCFQCGGNEGARQGAVADATKCRIISVCDEDQTCFVSTIHDAGMIKHEFGCAQKLYCQMHTVMALEQRGISSGVDVQHLALFGNVTLVGRKRHTELCYSCCGDSLCNNAECQIVKEREYSCRILNHLNYFYPN
ncbi:hypothetical protein ACJMK2_039472 [Sinanodonta woodiana]|uniref:Sodefrin-like factor n=1 Tax=Sinanodonta woodiana TaxID=1069815 RepID=A0ABD3WC37_SINWO